MFQWQTWTEYLEVNVTIKTINEWWADNLLGVIALVVVVAAMCHSCVDGIDRTIKVEEEKARSWTALLERPAAYRLSTPTWSQMEALEALRLTSRGRAEWYQEKEL